MQQSLCKDGKTAYHEYVLLYVDNCLVIRDRDESVIQNEIGKYFCLKEESIGDPGQYLGGNIREVVLEKGANAWAFGSKNYAKAAVNNVVDYLANRSQKLVAKAPTPLSSGYRPDVDVTGKLDLADASYYHSLIGILRWIVELGRIDITCEVSIMSLHLALPHEGHTK